METIAFFGAGLLGSGFIEAFRKRGVAVNVWNRTYEKAQALESTGARAFRSPADAVTNVDRVHICLSSDDAVDAALSAALPALDRAVPIVDHTTVSVKGVLERHARLTRAQYTFQHAPVFMGPANAAESSGMMLLSGDAAQAERLRPALAPMTGDLWYVGERIDAAALYKLAGNAMILAVIGGLNDVFSIADANAMARPDLFRVFERFSPGNQLGGRGKRMAEGDFSAAWTLSMAHKDATLMQDAATGNALPVIDAMQTLMRRAIDAGYEDDDLGAVARR